MCALSYVGELVANQENRDGETTRENAYVRLYVSRETEEPLLRLCRVIKTRVRNFKGSRCQTRGGTKVRSTWAPAIDTLEAALTFVSVTDIRYGK